MCERAESGAVADRVRAHAPLTASIPPPPPPKQTHSSDDVFKSLEGRDLSAQEKAIIQQRVRVQREKGREGGSGRECVRACAPFVFSAETVSAVPPFRGRTRARRGRPGDVEAFCGVAGPELGGWRARAGAETRTLRATERRRENRPRASRSAPLSTPPLPLLSVSRPPQTNQVDLQRRMLAAFEAQERARKVAEVRAMCPTITEAEAARAIELCRGDEGEAADRKSVV